MAITEIVNILFQAKDLTSGVFNSVERSLNSAKKSVGSFARDVIKAGGGTTTRTIAPGIRYQDPLTRKFVAAGTPGAIAVPFGGTKTEGGNAGFNVSRLAIATKAVDLAVDAFSFSLGKVKDAIGGAIDLQQQNLSSQIALSKTLGLTQAQAATFVQDFNYQAAILGKNLPIAASDIARFSTVIQTDFSRAIIGAGGSTDQFKTVLLDVSSKLAIATKTANVTDDRARQATAAFLAGAVGKRGLNQYDFFANNPILKQNLVTGLERIKPGADSFGDLSVFQRVKLLTDALNKSITKEDVALLQKSAGASISSFTDTLFDPQIGLFSIQRDLEPKVAGYQSVFSSFEKTLSLVIGEKGILAEIGRLFGGSADPMAVLRSGVDTLNNFLDDFRRNLAGLKKPDAGAIGAAVGKFAAQVVNGLTSGTLDAIDSINYGALFLGAIAGVASFFANLDWKVYLTAGLITIGVALIPPLLGAIATGVGVIASGIVAVVGGVPLAIGAAIALGVIAIAKLIGSNFDGIYSGIVRWGDTINSAVGNLLGGIWNAITGLFNKITGGISGLLSNVPSPGGIASGVGNFLSGAASSVGNFLFGSGYAGHIPTAARGSLMGAIATEARNAPTGAGLLIANTSETVLTPDQLTNLVSNTYSAGNTSSTSVTIAPGAISLNLPAGTPQEIAMQAIAIIEANLNQRLEDALA